MYPNKTVSLFITLILALCFIGTAGATNPRYTLQGTAGIEKKMEATSNKTKTDPKFEELIKDKVVTEGLFTFYKDTVKNELLMAIKPDQVGPIFLCGESVTQGDGKFYDNGSMRQTYPFYFKRVGENILLLEKNLRLRADSTKPVMGAIEAAVSDHLHGTAGIKFTPKDTTGVYLVDPAEFFIYDATNTSYQLGSRGKTGFNFDKKNSYFKLIKSFPQNSEIDVKLHYRTNNPQSGITLQDGYSFFLTYHFSLSSLPETDYVPRYADDRVGYFLTIYEDYNQYDRESAYTRYIERWNLKKKNADYDLSEPVEPIVYWIENTVPLEYRDAIRKAIEFWNHSFEKIGFKNAIVAKQMPDTASWDPADVRYNVIQWMVLPEQYYAVGPHRSNPFTGQIYDADIRISSDWVRLMYTLMEDYISPVTYNGSTPETEDNLHLYDYGTDPQYFCDYQSSSAENAAFDMGYLSSAITDPKLKDSLTSEYVQQYLTEVVAHEVGHTLGLRHNFKASTIYTMQQVNDPKFTAEHSTTGSIMDYMSANIAGPEAAQKGDFYAPFPGPWDDWVIEYGYTDFGDLSSEEEIPKLRKIADRSTEPQLIYATDEDTFGWSNKKTDPYSNQHDLGDDPLKFAEHKIAQSRELWTKSIKDMEKPGERYVKLRNIFNTGWRSYREMASIAPQYIGGIQIYRNHIGQANGHLPFELVPAAQQRRAMKLLDEYIFAADAFDIPQELHNKLQPERFPDFKGSSYRISQLDYPFHETVLKTQVTALNKLYDKYTLGRLVNNQVRANTGDDEYTMYDMFQDCRRSIWSEIVKPENVNSFRRQLQLAHLQTIIGIFLSKPGTFPFDAVTLAANDLDVLYEAARKAVNSGSIDNMTRAHFKEVMRQIDAARKAQKSYSEK